MRQITVSLIVFSLLAVGGCASPVAEGQMRVSGPFLASDAPLFDDGVDFIADPSRLDGSWLGDFRRNLDARIDRADAIAVVRVDAIGRGRDLAGGETQVLSVTTEQVLKGKLPEQATFSSESSSPGFGTLTRAQSRLLHQRFTVFVRWYEREDEVVALHFHLSPATEAVIGTVGARTR